MIINKEICTPGSRAFLFTRANFGDLSRDAASKKKLVLLLSSVDTGEREKGSVDPLVRCVYDERWCDELVDRTQEECHEER